MSGRRGEDCSHVPSFKAEGPGGDAVWREAEDGARRIVNRAETRMSACSSGLGMPNGQADRTERGGAAGGEGGWE